MEDVQAQSSSGRFSMLKAWGIYFGIAFLMFVDLGIAFTWNKYSFQIVFFPYLLFGILLNRFVLRQIVEWHPVYNTIDNVAMEKLKMIVFWPFSYPILFFKILVSKHL